jgi:hypothetical protein
MLRRDFLTSSLLTLLTYGCSCAQRAAASTSVQGCRAAGTGGASQFRMRGSSGNDLHDEYFRSFTESLTSTFALKPGVAFYDDGDAPNALALPANLMPEGQDGTVLMGVNLFAIEISRAFGTTPSRDQTDDVAQGKLRFSGLGDPVLLNAPRRTIKPQLDLKTTANAYFAPAVIMAHEFGHIMQYKAGLTPTGPWQMEPHADFLAGWFLANATKNITGEIVILDAAGKGAGQVLTPDAIVEEAAKSIFEKGDTLFNDPTHHGQPEFRAAMVRSGYDAGTLDANQAFAKGKRMAGLR